LRLVTGLPHDSRFSKPERLRLPSHTHGARHREHSVTNAKESPMQHQDTSKKQPAGQSPGQPRSSQPHAADPWSTKRSGSQDNPKDSHASGDIAGAASNAYDRLEDAGGEVRDHL